MFVSVPASTSPPLQKQVRKKKEKTHDGNIPNTTYDAAPSASEQTDEIRPIQTRNLKEELFTDEDDKQWRYLTTDKLSC